MQKQTNGSCHTVNATCDLRLSSSCHTMSWQFQMGKYMGKYTGFRLLRYVYYAMNFMTTLNCGATTRIPMWNKLLTVYLVQPSATSSHILSRRHIALWPSIGASTRALCGQYIMAETEGAGVPPVTLGIIPLDMWDDFQNFVNGIMKVNDYRETKRGDYGGGKMVLPLFWWSAILWAVSQKQFAIWLRSGKATVNLNSGLWRLRFGGKYSWM